ncbi:putative inactive cadmium/zinc-transporting ATPase HMA3 [Rhododendron vialii]|uniref:putative inactive cadmium/zinc-transporting ATPase HMA3 n=1 Tax=Rhododendron vialii TaxID=182163 RepID=UPI00265E9692|nr:putative inactive cadmium/zinc-transporting ATPase HMA3 [Rhododendron vialii]XP_058212664.1 putative inactive cadmium/zinc-transporting ATPase HMA3 [Rhododendron vialii]
MAAKKKLQKSYFDVVGLCCSSEVPLIEKILKPMEGVKDVSVIVASRTLIVLHDDLLISQLQIVKALNQARLEANVRVYGGADYQKKWPSPYAIACGVFLMLSLLKFAYPPLQWLALGSVVVGIYPIFLRGLTSLKNRTLDSNTLVLIAVIGSVGLRDYWEAASIVFLFTIAQWLEARASHKATAVMSSLMNIVPQKAVLAENGHEVDADEVKVGTVIAVKAGEIIPIDGIVVEGRCEVDEKTLTGESFPVSKQIDSTVLAGTINVNGYVSVRTTALAEDCVVARMAKLVEEAQNNKSKAQRFIDKCAKVYTPAVIIISAGLAAVPFVLKLDNKRHWLHLALVVLVSACPCALILSTPVATFCALSKAATSGVLIKGGEYLETLSKIKIMAFDKTGTITRGEFEVTDFHSVSDDVALNTLLYWVSSIESKSSHPMAAALIDYAQKLSIEVKPERVEEFENFPGEGIHGKIDGKDVYVGNQKIALRAGCVTAPSIVGHCSKGKSVSYIFLGAAPAGIFSLSDSCRTGVREAINELKSMNIKSVMLTGDSHEAAVEAQKQLAGALDVVHDGLLPKDKAQIISNFQKEAPTAMVGDGLNDAPALATADIGISMGISGSALATETGNVILMSNDIRKIPKVLQLARKTQWKVIQNVFFSISTKTAVLALAVMGHPLVWAAVLADVGTCLVVILNSMLLLRGNDKHVKCCKSSSPAAHAHKHRSNSRSHHSSHKHQHGCFDGSEAQKVSNPHKCCTLRCNKKTSNPADTNGGCANKDHRHNSKHTNHRSSVLGIPCMAANEIHKHGCEEKVTNLIGSSHNICIPGDENHKHEVEHCDHENNNDENQQKQRHLNQTSCGITQSTTMDGNCHLIHCLENSVQDHLVDSEAHNVAATGCQQNTESEACFGCNGHVEKNCSLLHPTMDSSLGSNHMGCVSTQACLSLEKRQIGGCCSSFRKECCSKTGHFGTSFREGLSEIIID